MLLGISPLQFIVFAVVQELCESLGFCSLALISQNAHQPATSQRIRKGTSACYVARMAAELSAISLKFESPNMKRPVTPDAVTIAEDPSEFVDTVRKSSEDSKRPFTIPEIRSGLAVADLEWRSMVLFGVYTGQRLADIGSLSWDNLDLERNGIRLRSRKTGKRILIPIATPLRVHIDTRRRSTR